MLDVVGSERAVLLILANAIGVFCRIAERALVEVGCAAAADVEHDQPNGAADRSIRPVTGTKGVSPSIHADFARNWTVDDYQRRSHVGSCLHAIEVERSIGQSQHGGAHYGGVLGLAASHHHVDG